MLRTEHFDGTAKRHYIAVNPFILGDGDGDIAGTVGIPGDQFVIVIVIEAIEHARLKPEPEGDAFFHSLARCVIRHRRLRSTVEALTGNGQAFHPGDAEDTEGPPHAAVPPDVPGGALELEAHGLHVAAAPDALGVDVIERNDAVLEDGLPDIEEPVVFIGAGAPGGELDVHPVGGGSVLEYRADFIEDGVDFRVAGGLKRFQSQQDTVALAVVDEGTAEGVVLEDGDAAAVNFPEDLLLLSPSTPEVYKEIFLPENETPVIVIGIGDLDFLGVLDVRKINLINCFFPGLCCAFISFFKD